MVRNMVGFYGEFGALDEGTGWAADCMTWSFVICTQQSSSGDQTENNWMFF
jgi:hypothetical protein